MTDKEKNYVQSTIENEGFDYVFVHYSDFEDIKDEEFHRLRKEFIEARDKLGDYVGWDD